MSFLCRLRSLREIHFFEAELHQINRARFYQEQLVVNVRRLEKRGCFPTSGVVVENFFRSVHFLAVKRFFFFFPFPVYRAVNTTNIDRGNCCGCKSVDPWLSCCLEIFMLSLDWWTETFACTEKRMPRRSPSHCRKPGLLSITDGAELQTHTHTRLFIIWVFSLSSSTLQHGWIWVHEGNKTVRGATISNQEIYVSVSQWIGQSWESKNWWCY